jgi:DNA-binding IclR family transcriptional regulator
LQRVPRPSPQTDRVIALTRLLAAHPDEGFTMAELARRLRLNKATLYPMMATLTEAGWLVREPAGKTFRLGPELIAIGEAAGKRLPATQLARPTMVALATELGVTCAAFTASDGIATLTDQVWDVRSTVQPLRSGLWAAIKAPFGALFTAWADDATIDEWAAGPDADAYRASLKASRDRGYVVELRTGSGNVLTSSSLIETMIVDSDFLVAGLDPAAVYSPSTIEAPVFGPDGSIAVGLVLVGLPRTMTGAEIEAMAGRLVAATTALTASLR